jgi:hypothetical protein
MENTCKKQGRHLVGQSNVIEWLCTLFAYLPQFESGHSLTTITGATWLPDSPSMVHPKVPTWILVTGSPAGF